MAHFLIAQVTVTDDSWKVHEIVARHGGNYLSRSANIETLEGPESTPSLIALIEFPSKDALHAFIQDPEYAPFAAARQAGSDSRFLGIDDTDVAGSIPYLTPGS